MNHGHFYCGMPEVTEGYRLWDGLRLQWRSSIYLAAYRLYPQRGGALEDIVSLTPIGEPRQKITVASLKEKKLRHEPITCLTAYDYSSARLVDEAAIDIVLVGDSLAKPCSAMRTLSRSRLTRCCTTAKLSGAGESMRY